MASFYLTHIFIEGLFEAINIEHLPITRYTHTVCIQQSQCSHPGVNLQLTSDELWRADITGTVKT